MFRTVPSTVNDTIELVDIAFPFLMAFPYLDVIKNRGLKTVKNVTVTSLCIVTALKGESWYTLLFVL